MKAATPPGPNLRVDYRCAGRDLKCRSGRGLHWPELGDSAVVWAECAAP